jgi:hypothetical protein
LQDFGECIQSSQIGPHLVQPSSARPKAITPRINANRLNMAERFPMPHHTASSRAFSSRAGLLFLSTECPLWRFQAKWSPVRVKKTRQMKNLEPRFDSIETEEALAVC